MSNPPPATAAAAPAPASDVRERRREERARLKREQILDAAEATFGELGYHRAGLKLIAERCGIAVGSVYNFFESKDDLYRAIFVRGGVEQHARMKEVADGPGTGLDTLVAIVWSQTEYYREHPAYGKLAVISSAPGARNDGLDTTLFREGYAVGMSLIQSAIDRGQADGTVRPGNPRALTRMALAMSSTFHLMDPATAPFPEEYPFEEFEAMLRAAFSPPQA